MPRTRTTFLCTECGGAAPRWLGQCPHCQAWNTLVEETLRSGGRKAPKRSSAPVPDSRPVPLSEVESGSTGRWRTGLSEFDFVLGGGIVPGSMLLLGGEPGIGKSTLLLQVSARLAATGLKVLYVSGEESAYQVKLRAQRLNEDADGVQVLAETDADAILERAESLRPDVLVVDSIQTLYSDRLDSAPGSVSQVREAAGSLQRAAKTWSMAAFVVGHVTKGGGIAGPKTLEHVVDVVLYFESSGATDHRVVRATKNRFGAADEIAVFRMDRAGLLALENPSALFLEGRQERVSGSAVAAALGGTRTMLVEVQALATRSVYGTPQRVTTGFEGRRLSLLLAVLEKRGGIDGTGSDIFLNVVGGLRLNEPAGDLAVIAAVASALRDQPADDQAVFVGEVGLGGEIRPVSQLERRIAEAARLGFQRVYVSESAKLPEETPIALERVQDLDQLLGRLFA